MSNDTKYRLVYFNFKSLGEPLRWLLEYTGTSYIDERIPSDMIEWFTQRKGDFEDSVGQLPVLHEEGKRSLCQSSAISRYLATKHGLVGNNEWDNARLDEVISLLFDLYDTWRKATVLETDQDRKTQAKTTLLDPQFRLYYGKFSKILDEQDGDYILGEKLTHADFWLAHLVSMWDEPMTGEGPLKLPPGFVEITDSDIFIGLTDEFPLLKKHKQTITAIPQIKKWISKRPQTKM